MERVALRFLNPHQIGEVGAQLPIHMEQQGAADRRAVSACPTHLNAHYPILHAGQSHTATM